eukprot:4010-Pelagococcus_subviridis.AAC.1
MPRPGAIPMPPIIPMPPPPPPGFERTHDRRTREVPIRALFRPAMAASAHDRCANCTNPHPLPCGILMYTSSPYGSKCIRSSASDIDPKPPTKT